jgi:hypothetical protein
VWNEDYDSVITAPCSSLLRSVELQFTVTKMKVRNFAHKGLKWLYEDDKAMGVRPATVDKLLPLERKEPRLCP